MNGRRVSICRKLWLVNLSHLLVIVLLSGSAEHVVGVDFQTREDQAPIKVKRGENCAITVTLVDVPSNFTGYNIFWVKLGTFVTVKLDLTKENRLHNYVASFNPDTNEATLKVEGVELSHNGSYVLQISDPVISIQSGKYPIIVLVSPSRVAITGGATHTVVEGNTINLTCTTYGSNPGVQVGWLLNNVEVSLPIVTKATLDGALYTTTSYITVTTEHSGDGDKYTCVVSGRQMDGEQTAVTTLNVQYSPKVTMSVYPNLLNQVENSEATFRCTADAQPAVSTWKWFLGDTELIETSSDMTYTSMPADMDGKTLKCLATNSIGSGEMAHTLSVHYGPAFLTVPDNVEADIGDSVTLTCEITGNPSPRVIWVKGEHSAAIITSSTQLVITSVQENHFGAYQCVGTVPGDFPTIKSVAYILKKDVPEISGPTKFTFSQGQTAVLSCKVKCIPAPSEIIWTKRKTGELIQGSNSRYSTHQEPDVYGVTAVLSIQNLASNDFTEYNCTVVNERGRDSVILTLSQTDDFPWLWVVIGAVVFIVVAIAIAVAVCCCCRKRKDKTSSAGSSVGSINPYWVDTRYLSSNARTTPSDRLNFYKTCSLSVVSNTTDSSIKKPADGMEQEELSSLPEYGMRPIDTWRTNQDPTHTAFDSLDYPTHEKPELYGSFRSSPCTTFNPPQSAFPPGNYGSYRVQHPRIELPSTAAPQYSTLPIRPSMLPPNEFDRRFACGSNSRIDESFPEPPLEHKLATNV